MENIQQHISALERHLGDRAKSPLFARLASLYLETGRPKDALRMCDSGLAHFPFYSTGHLIKGQALLKLELYNEARRELEFVHSWLPTNPTVASLLESIPVSEEQVLGDPDSSSSDAAGISSEPPAASHTLETGTPTETSGGDFFGAVTSQPAPEGAEPGVVEPLSAPLAASNDFGLPSDAPTTEPEAEMPESPGSVFGTMEGFGGGGQETVEQAYEQTAGDGDAMSAFGGAFGEPSTAVGPVENFQEYAERMRGELGPTGIITLEEYLRSPRTTDAPIQEVQATTPGPSPEESQPEFGGFGEVGTIVEEPHVTEPVSDMNDGFGGQGGTEEPVTEPPTDAGEPEVSADDPFGGMSAFEQPAEETTVTSPDMPGKAEGFTGPDFSGMPDTEDPIMAETPGEFSPPDAGGFEGPPPDLPQATAGASKIEEFAEKLQEAKKITPIIDFSTKVSSSSPSTADETAAGAGFVTPTLAEIYAKQGWYDDAINAYKTLAKTRPAEKDKFEERVKELEEEKSKAG